MPKKPKNAATRIPHIRQKQCPKCGYSCEEHWNLVTVNNYTTKESYAADICPRCFVEWMNQTFPHMALEKQAESSLPEASLPEAPEV